MKHQTKNISLTKAIFLLFLQGICLYIIFYLLSTRVYFSDLDRGALAFSLAFVMISSLVIMTMLGRLREIEKEKRVEATA